MSSQRKIDADLLSKELVFTSSRSSGAGGQNVNKVNSKVSLQFNITSSEILTGDEKEILLTKLKSKITTDGVLILSSQATRSQFQNKEGVIQKLDKLLTKAFEKKKVRKSTKPSKSSVQTRLTNKKQHSEKKKQRQKYNP